MEDNNIQDSCCNSKYASIRQMDKLDEMLGRRFPFYPRTVIQAIHDGRTGASLEAILAQYNNIYVQYQGTAGRTRNIVPKEMRRKGIIISYVDMQGNAITEKCVNDAHRDNFRWGLDVNWVRVDELTLSGDISVSVKGTWVINGEDTGIAALGPKGDNGLTPWLKTIDNKLHFSYDNETWEVCSDYIAAYFRFQDNKFQISRDNKTWSDLSGEVTNSLSIKAYVTDKSQYPNPKQGDMIMVGPTYADDDTEHTKPIYHLNIYNAEGWIDNGPFQSINAGVVQELGNSETEVMSQKAVSEKFSELELKTDLVFNSTKLINTTTPPLSNIGEGYTAAGSTAGNGWSKSDFIPINYGDKIEYKLDGWQNFCIIALFNANKEIIIEGQIVGKTGIFSGSNNFVSGVFVNTDNNVKFAIAQTRQETVGSVSIKVTNYTNDFINKVEFEAYKKENENGEKELTESIAQIDGVLYSNEEDNIIINNSSGNGIAYSNGNNAGSGHYVTEKIAVFEGDRIDYTLSEASNFCMIGAWKNGVYSQSDSVAGIASLTSGTYIVPKGITEVKLGTNVYQGATAKIIRKEFRFATKEEFTKIKNIKPFNTDIDEHLIDEVCGKFYGERAIAHNKYMTSASKIVYVDTVGGNDDDNGLSQDTAVKTLTKANEILIDGDTLLIKRGSVFIAEETIEKNGIIIDCYGDPTKEKPTSYNLIDVTNSTNIEKVVGYQNIYRIAWENKGASGSDRAAIQVFVDGKACGDWTIYTRYAPSDYDVITQEGAMKYLDENVDDAAWCDAYLNNGFSNGWEPGTNYIYFAVSFDATDQATLNNHKIQITRSVGQLVKFTGKDTDLRNFIWQTICFNVVDPCKFNENVELYNFVRHGFHYECSWFMNCKTDVLEGIGKHYHYQPKNDQTYYEEIIIFGCKAMSRRQDRQGELFDGHGTNTSTPVVTYNRAYVINCYAENLLYASDSPNIANTYIKNLVLKDCASISVYRNNTIIDGVFGTLNPISNTPIITTPSKNGNGLLKNVHLNINSENGGTYLMYDTGYNKEYGNMVFDDVCLLVRKKAENAGTYELSTTFAFWNGNSNFKFKGCTFACKHDSGVKENFARNTDDTTDFSLMQFEDCIIAGIVNNKNLSNDGITWIDNTDDLFLSEYLPRLMYVNGGLRILKNL
jgi:hypothetical protein